MDWWIERWIDWSIDGLMDQLIDGLMDDKIDGLMNWSMYRWMDGLMDWWIDRSLHWSMDRWIDRSMNRPINGYIDWMMDGWINGSMHRWMDWSNERKMRREGIQGTSNENRERGVGAVGGEWRKMRGNAVKEHYSQNSCSCVIYLVDGAQSKCRRKRWFVFYTFLWTCRDTAKSQAFGIVYNTQAGSLNGW